MKNIIIFCFVIVLSISSSGLSFAQAPSFVWAKVAGGQNSAAGDIVTDAHGNIYTCGTYSDSIVFGTFKLTGSSSFIAKNDVQGNIIWAVNIGYGNFGWNSKNYLISLLV